MLRPDAPQSQSSKLVVVVFWCRTAESDDTRYQPQFWMTSLDQAKILYQLPRLELEGRGNHLAPVGKIRSVRYLFYQPMDEKIKTWPLSFPAKENPNMD